MVLWIDDLLYGWIWEKMKRNESYNSELSSLGKPRNWGCFKVLQDEVDFAGHWL